MMGGVVGVNRKTAASHNDLLVSVISLLFILCACMDWKWGFEF
jgi:hypothetical protein